MKKKNKKSQLGPGAQGDHPLRTFRDHCGRALLVTASYQVISLCMTPARVQNLPWEPNGRRPRSSIGTYLPSLFTSPAFAQVPPVVECRCVGGCIGCTGISARTSRAPSRSSAPAPLAPADQTYNDGNAMLRAQRYQEAAQLYRRALQLRPKFALAHYALAIALSNLGNGQEALSEAGQALKYGLKDPYKKECRDWVQKLQNVAVATQAFNEGNQMYGLKRWAAAEAAYRKAFLYDPDAPTADNLGLTLEAENRVKEAEEFYRKAISLNPSFPNAYSHLGDLLLNQGRNEEAESVLRRAVQLSGTALNRGNLGVCLARLAEADDAKEPDRTARSAEAETLLRNALAAEPTVELFRDSFVKVLLDKCVALGNRNDYAAAEAAAREGIKWIPQNPSLHNNLGVALMYLGRLQDSESEFREALRLRPEYAKAHSSLGSVLMAQGRLEEAEGEMREALRLAPDSKLAQANLDELLAKKAAQKPAEPVTSQESKTKAASVPEPTGAPSGSFPVNPPSTASAPDSIAAAVQRAIDQAYSNLGSTREGLSKKTAETNTTGVAEEAAAGSRQVIDTPGNPAKAPIDTESVRHIGIEKAVQSLVSRIPPEAMKSDEAIKTSVAWFARREVDKEQTRAQLADVQAEIDNHHGDPAVLAIKQQQLSTELKRIEEDQETAKKAIQKRLIDLHRDWVEEPPNKEKPQ